MDDIWNLVNDPPRRTGLRNSDSSTPRDPAADFQACLNAVHERVQFTREDEKDKSIPFLDILITRQDDGSLSTTVYRKDSNTNISIKPQSCQEPSVAVATFKGELCRCYRLCSSIENTKKSIEYVTNIFEDNGHDRKMLQKIVDTYKPPSGKKQNKKTDIESSKPTPSENETRGLFEALPFKYSPLGAIDDVGEMEEEETEEEEQKTYACLPYIPEISHQMRRALKKAGVHTTFKSAPKLKNILCANNKTKPDPTKTKGVYKYTCKCSNKSVYVGQTARSFEQRWKEHGAAINHEQWSHSGITQHYQHCHHQFNKDNFEIINKMQGKHKRRLAYDIKIREALEIRQHGCGPGKGLNEDMGSYIRTDIWDPVLNHIRDN